MTSAMSQLAALKKWMTPLQLSSKLLERRVCNNVAAIVAPVYWWNSEIDSICKEYM